MKSNTIYSNHFSFGWLGIVFSEEINEMKFSEEIPSLGSKKHNEKKIFYDKKPL